MGATSRVGRYELGERIGSGGMAEVFRARAPGLGRAMQDVALKRMHAHLAEDPEFVQLFFREAQVASSLNHPNVVNLLESGQDGDVYFLAMELVEGLSLRRLIKAVQASEEPFDVSAAATIVAHVCAGLHHAHERRGESDEPLGIVHRDVSPGNIFLSIDGSVKLGDFGVATATAEWTALRSRTGSIRGKVAYMAPEQARGQAVDRRADVFAIGNVLFELLEGRRLLQAEGEVELLHELVFGGYGDGRVTRKDCPPALVDAIARALAADPQERFPSAAAFSDGLKAAVPLLDATELAGYVGAYHDDEPTTHVRVENVKPRGGATTALADVPAPALSAGETETLVPRTVALPSSVAAELPKRRAVAALGAIAAAVAGLLSWRAFAPADGVQTAVVGPLGNVPPLPSPAAVLDAPAPPPVEASPSEDEDAKNPPRRRSTAGKRKQRRRRKSARTAPEASPSRPPPGEALFPD